MILTSLTLKETLEGFEKKEFSSVEVTKAYLDRIKKYNHKINAFVTVDEEGAVKKAKECDILHKKGDKKPLLGIPVGLKDNWLTKNLRTTATSKVLDNYIPQYDATATKRLKEAGAVILGKLNMDAWGHGSSGEHSDYGNTLNPWDFTRVPGGSSSGAGAAVASDMCLTGTGSDTGGSIRQPAANCNVVGIKPTYGRVSRYGMIAMGSSFDTYGCLTKTVWDNAKVLSVIAGHDSMDATSSKERVPPYEKLLDRSIKNIKIGIPKEYFTNDVEENVKKLCWDALLVLEKLGAKLLKISLPHTKYAYSVYGIICGSEISSNLGRYDGVRYGLGREMFGDEAKRRIMIGTHSLSVGYADKYYHQALKGRSLLIKDFVDAYKKVDLVACPVWPFPPFKFEERSMDPLQMYLADIFTITANLTGNPSLSIPVGFTSKKLPVGMQILGPNFREDLLYRVGYTYEQETQYYKVKPKI